MTTKTIITCAVTRFVPGKDDPMDPAAGSQLETAAARWRRRQRRAKSSVFSP
ncbi:MAG: hypothetical protein O3B76_08520 [Proteobacteria bacterium]|nr:hypothetical protein [Pseudomonadota bacterium]MDA1022441.1 hypothetical protein [Pseudomonadota bacterium]